LISALRVIFQLVKRYIGFMRLIDQADEEKKHFQHVLLSIPFKTQPSDMIRVLKMAANEKRKSETEEERANYFSSPEWAWQLSWNVQYYLFFAEMRAMAAAAGIGGELRFSEIVRKKKKECLKFRRA